MPTILHRAARRLTGHLGVHGFGLVLIAVIWALLALGILTAPTVAPDEGRQLFHQYIPPTYAATLWLTTALGTLASAIDRDGPRRDGLALAAAVMPPTLWMASYVWSWIASLVPGAPAGSPRGWLSAAIYACLVGLVWLVAAIPDERINQR